jgi:hypothetical protein
MLPPCVLWIDPGGMTGLAWLYDTGRAFWCDEHDFQTACARIEDTCHRYQNTLAIGWETYQVTRREPQTNARDAIEPIGAARYLAGKHGCLVLPEAPRHTPKPHEREWLQAAGWWVRGKDDAQSAACHMYRWLLRSGQMPPGVTGRVSEAVATLAAGRRQKT